MPEIQTKLRLRSYAGILGFVALLFVLVDPPSWAPPLALLILSPLSGFGVGLWILWLARTVARRLTEDVG